MRLNPFVRKAAWMAIACGSFTLYAAMVDRTVFASVGKLGGGRGARTSEQSSMYSRARRAEYSRCTVLKLQREARSKENELHLAGCEPTYLTSLMSSQAVLGASPDPASWLSLPRWHRRVSSMCSRFRLTLWTLAKI